MKKTIETILIINLVMAILTGVVWLGLGNAKEARELIEWGVSDLVQGEDISRDIEIYKPK